MGVLDVLKDKAPQLALMLLSGRQGGLPAQSGLLHGFNVRRELDERDAHYNREQALREQQLQFQQDNATADNTRMDEELQRRKFADVLAMIERATQQQAATATDPTQAENAIMGQAAAGAQVLGLPPDQLTGMVPSMAPVISGKQKKQASDLLANIEKQPVYKASVGTPEFETQIVQFNGEGIPIGRLREIAGTNLKTQGGQPFTPPVQAPSASDGSSDLDRSFNREKAARELKLGRPLDPNEIAGLDREVRQSVRSINAPISQPSGLPPNVQRRVDNKSRAFEQLPVVKRTQMMSESVGFAQGLNTNTTNPADDQALIYAFAKAMDPDSVVREGEYATVQKYAQSWAERFGFDMKRIFSNTAFLTPQARENMKATILAKFAAGKQQYDNVRKSYVEQINKITNGTDGEDYLTDYGSAFPQAAGQGAPPAGIPTYQDYLNSRPGGAR